jgi:ribonuclease-3
MSSDAGGDSAGKDALGGQPPEIVLPDSLAVYLDPVGEIPHLIEALTHPSFSNEQRGPRRADNQRLEFLGDAVLGLLVSELLMLRFPAAQEGELSRMRSLLVNTDALAGWARRVDLGQALRLGRGADAAGERDRDNVLADAVEALMGAVYLDRGEGAARALAAEVVCELLARLEGGQGAGRDPKSELQERVQADGGSSPRYRVIGSEGPDHQRVFIIVVEVSGRVLGEGRGRSKKLAEQAAARSAIDAYEVISSSRKRGEALSPRRESLAPGSQVPTTLASPVQDDPAFAGPERNDRGPT